MDTRSLGTDGPQVSVVCLGAWPRTEISGENLRLLKNLGSIARFRNVAIDPNTKI